VMDRIIGHHYFTAGIERDVYEDAEGRQYVLGRDCERIYGPRPTDGICKAEAARGDIARSARSALAPEAQPFQDLIDCILCILYSMAGLTDAEAQGLEKRLEGML